MVAIAQSVEHRLVVPRVAGSSPVSHPEMGEVQTSDESKYSWFGLNLSLLSSSTQQPR